MLVEASTEARGLAVAPRLDWRTKVLYGVGDIATAIKTAMFGLFVLYFYSTVMGLPAALVGLCTALGSIWDAVIDPYVGYLSDTRRSRLGRRHGFMLAGSLTMGLAFWAFFSPPPNLSQTGLFLWLLVTLLVFRTTTSVYGIPYSALGAELSQDYHERTSINALRGTLALIGTLATAGLSFVIFFPDTGGSADPKLNYAGYPAMGVVFGLMMTLAGLIATLSTLAFRSQPETGQATRRQRGSFLATSIQCLRNQSFRVLFFSFSLFYLGLIINTSLSIYYLTYYVEITSSSHLSLLQTILYVSSVVGVFFWLFVSRYVQKHTLYLGATLATAVIMIAALTLVGEGNLFGTGNVLVVAIGQALAGFFTSVIWFMPPSLIADVADEDELSSGARREGSFFGLQFFGQQLAAAGSLLTAGVLVDVFAGLVAGQAEQTPLTVQRIGILYGVLPAGLLIVAALLSMRYSLTRTRLKAIQAELAERRRLREREAARPQGNSDQQAEGQPAIG